MPRNTCFCLFFVILAKGKADIVMVDNKCMYSYVHAQSSQFCPKKSINWNPAKLPIFIEDNERKYNVIGD